MITLNNYAIPVQDLLPFIFELCQSSRSKLTLFRKGHYMFGMFTKIPCPVIE